MKNLTMSSAWITFLTLLSAMICGMWLRSGGAGVIEFHIICGILSVVFSFITLILSTITFRRMKKGN